MEKWTRNLQTIYVITMGDTIYRKIKFLNSKNNITKIDYSVTIVTYKQQQTYKFDWETKLN